MATTHVSAEHLVRLLSPHRGKWVAVEWPWRRVIASSADRDECLRLAGGHTMPLLYRVPAAPEGAGVA